MATRPRKLRWNGWNWGTRAAPLLADLETYANLSISYKWGGYSRGAGSSGILTPHMDAPWMDCRGEALRDWLTVGLHKNHQRYLPGSREQVFAGNPDDPKPKVDGFGDPVFHEEPALFLFRSPRAQVGLGELLTMCYRPIREGDRLSWLELGYRFEGEWDRLLRASPTTLRAEVAMHLLSKIDG